ncbi:MAG: Fic family protein [Paludibacteraceae bacterium]|nr:Fic family protein [Paludibacteraceae bacterium]
MNKIESLYQEWQSLQPISQEVQNKIDQKFMLEFNYNSNHIEGNTLTYGQTEMLLIFDKVDGNAKMHDLEEMKASNVGLRMIQEEAKDTDRPLTEYFIRELHRTLLRENYIKYRKLEDGSITTSTIHAGQYKEQPNTVTTQTGERFEYASPEETPALMRDLIEWYNQEETAGIMTPIELASLFHYRYIRIHPFDDGNGRISRLLVNFILLRANYPMIIVRSDEKDKYLDTLNTCDIAVGLIPSDGAHANLEDIQPFVDYMTKCLERALTLRIKAAKGEDIEEKDDWKKKIKLLKKEAEAKRKGIIRKSAEEIIKISDKFIIPFAQRIGKAMHEFTNFYNTCLIEARQSNNNGYERIPFSSFTENLHNNPSKYEKFYFTIYMKNPTTLIKAGEMEEQFVYFQFDDEEYTITVNDTKNTYRYGIIPQENELEKFINEILNKFISSIQNKIMNE